MRGRVSDHRAELSRHAWPSGRPTCAAVWELTAYANGYLANTNHFSGELHRPILQLGASYGLSSLAELPPPRYNLRHRGSGASIEERHEDRPSSWLVRMNTLRT